MARFEEMSDEELVELSQCGERSALEELTLRYSKLVRSMARDYFLVGAEREDLIQEGMIGLFNAINTFDRDRNVKFSTYGSRVVANSLTNAIIRYNRKKYSPMSDYLSLDLPVYDEDSETTLLDMLHSKSSSDPQDIYIKNETADEINELLKSLLSRLEYKVAKLYASGFTYRRIASELQISEKSVDACLQRAKKKIRLTFKSY